MRVEACGVRSQGSSGGTGTDSAGLYASFRLVLQAPKATPPAVIAELAKRAQEVMKLPDVRAKLQNSDVTALGTTSAQAQATLNQEMVRWEPVVKRLGLTAD